MTTRIITYLVGNPYKPSFATVTGWGVDPKYTIHGSYGLKNIESTLDGGWWRCELGGRHKWSVIRMSRFDMWCLDMLKGSNEYLYIVYIYVYI